MLTGSSLLFMKCHQEDSMARLKLFLAIFLLIAATSASADPFRFNKVDANTLRIRFDDSISARAVYRAVQDFFLVYRFKDCSAKIEMAAHGPSVLIQNFFCNTQDVELELGRLYLFLETNAPKHSVSPMAVVCDGLSVLGIPNCGAQPVPVDSTIYEQSPYAPPASAPPPQDPFYGVSNVQLLVTIATLNGPTKQMFEAEAKRRGLVSEPAPEVAKPIAQLLPLSAASAQKTVAKLEPITRIRLTKRLSTHWRAVGKAFGLESWILDNIEADFRTLEDRADRMLRTLMERIASKFTVEALYQALVRLELIEEASWLASQP
jgi:hypothetical protein